MGLSRWEYWSGLPFPPPGDLPDPEIEQGSPPLQVNSLPTEPPGEPHLSVIILNISGLNLPIKRHRLAGCIEKQDPTTSCLPDSVSALKRNIGSKWMDGKWYSKKWQAKQSRCSHLRSGQIDFKSNKRTGWAYIMMKGTVHQDVIFINI